MKIIICNSDKVRHVLAPLSASLTAIEEQVILWDKQLKPVFDMFEEQKPDLVILDQADIDKDVVRALQDYPDTKYIVYGVHIPETILKIAAPKALLVPPFIPETILQHLADNVPYVVLKPSANIVQYSGGYNIYAMESDILHIYNPHDDSFSLGLFNQTMINTDWMVKIIGPTKALSELFVGTVNRLETINFMKSAKIVIDHNYHTMYDAIANGIFVITNQKQDIVPYYSSTEELLSLIDKYLSNEKLRRKAIKQAKKEVLASHTCFHRLIELGKLLEIDEWEKSSLEAIGRFII